MFEFGRTLQRLRDERDYSREYLLEVSGIDRSTLWRIERGLVLPRVETIQKLAAALASCPERYARTLQTPDHLFIQLVQAFGEDARSRAARAHPSVRELMRLGWLGDAVDRPE